MSEKSAEREDEKTPEVTVAAKPLNTRPIPELPIIPDRDRRRREYTGWIAWFDRYRGSWI